MKSRPHKIIDELIRIEAKKRNTYINLHGNIGREFSKYPIIQMGQILKMSKLSSYENEMVLNKINLFSNKCKQNCIIK